MNFPREKPNKAWLYKTSSSIILILLIACHHPSQPEADPDPDPVVNDKPKIVFTSNRDNIHHHFQLYIMDNDGKNQRPLTRDTRNYLALGFSPDGKKIIYYSKDGVNAGRVAIRRGGFDIPLAFKVRRGERVLLFVCKADPERGGWSNVYTVLDQPKGSDGFEPLYCIPPATLPGGWPLRGRVPVDGLRFEHHERVVYVTRGSLERSLSAAGV